MKELRKMLGADIPILIAGNKADLEKNRHVSVEDAEKYCSFSFFESPFSPPLLSLSCPSSVSHWKKERRSEGNLDFFPFLFLFLLGTPKQ